MANNNFIDKVLLKLSLVNIRLRCSLTRLHIQIEMQSPYILSLIQDFIILQPEYQFIWNLNNKNYIPAYDLTNIPAFVQLKDYLTGQNLLSFDEAEWLDDAIHETLLDDIST